MNWVVGALIGLAALDGAFAGFRSSCGRTGLIRHRRQDVAAHLHGLATAAALLAPVAAVVLIDLAARPARWNAYLDAGRAMLALYLPFGAIVLGALAGYALLPWRHRFLASALILGPFTFARPFVALAGALLAGYSTHDVLATAAALTAVAAALTVEPMQNRRWTHHLARSRTATPSARA